MNATKKKAVAPLLCLILLVGMNCAGQGVKRKGAVAKPGATKAVAGKAVAGKPVAVRPETMEEVLLKIRKEYGRINADSGRFRVVSEKLEGPSVVGGKITRYYDGDTMRKAILVFYGETGKTVIDYYYSNRKLFFSFERNTWYNKPMAEKGAKVTKEEENRLYFNKQKLVRWANKKGKLIDKDLYADKEKELFEVMKVVRP
jgi:hypothetical protein